MKLVMFDMDGTLFDSAGFIVETVRASFAKCDLPMPSHKDSRSIIGLSLDVALGQLSGLQGEKLDDLVEIYRTEFRARLRTEDEQSSLFDGALQVLETLQNSPDHLLGIATGKGLSGVHRVLELHGLSDYFVTKQTPDHNPSKPHPGMLMRAMDETGISAENIIMIGDTTYDMTMARAAKTAALGVSWGVHDVADLQQAGADQIIDEYDQMLDAIKKGFDLHKGAR